MFLETIESILNYKCNDVNKSYQIIYDSRNKNQVLLTEFISKAPNGITKTYHISVNDKFNNDFEIVIRVVGVLDRISSVREVSYHSSIRFTCMKPMKKRNIRLIGIFNSPLKPVIVYQDGLYKKHERLREILKLEGIAKSIPESILQIDVYNHKKYFDIVFLNFGKKSSDEMIESIKKVLSIADQIIHKIQKI